MKKIFFFLLAFFVACNTAYSQLSLADGDKLTVELAGAVTTNEATFIVRYDSVTAFGTTNGTTAANVVNNQTGSSVTLNSVELYNNDTASVTATFKLDATTDYTLRKVTLSSGDSLRWDSNGLSVVNSNGEKKSTTTSLERVGAANGTGVVATEAGSSFLHVTTLTLTNTPITMADEAGVVAYGGLKIYDFPEGSVNIIGARVKGTLTLSAAGINANWDGDTSVGTVTASNNATLTSTEANVIPSTATPQASSSSTTGNSQSTLTQSGTVIDGTTTAADLYLNFLVDDADHDVTSTATNIICNGTIQIIWVDQGDY